MLPEGKHASCFRLMFDSCFFVKHLEMCPVLEGPGYTLVVRGTCISAVIE